VLDTPGAETPDLPIPSFVVRTHIDGLYRNDQPWPVESIAGRRVVAFAGIAKPERFFSLLESMGVTIARKVPFRDHHPFTNREIEDLGGEILITTEKDAVRLDGIRAGNFLELRISAKIQDFDRLLGIVLQRVGQKIP
jgi:tetraacyldisaccharide-1-P 4'-kinase